MNKGTRLFVAIIIIIAVAAGIYFILKKENPEPSPATEQTNDVDGALNDVSAVEAPSANPYQNAPDLNPIEQANPLRDLKTNPFSP